MKYLSAIFIAAVISSMTLAQDQNANKNCKEYCNSISQCSELVAENVANNWARPPVKNINEMKVLLKVSLDKSGIIKSVAIEKSSGNEKFDSSAMLAFKKVGSFCEIQGLSPEDYEKYFKTISFTFSPQDIRGF